MYPEVHSGCLTSLNMFNKYSDKTMVKAKIETQM